MVHRGERGWRAARRRRQHCARSVHHCRYQTRTKNRAGRLWCRRESLPLRCWNTISRGGLGARFRGRDGRTRWLGKERGRDSGGGRDNPSGREQKKRVDAERAGSQGRRSVEQIPICDPTPGQLGRNEWCAALVHDTAAHFRSVLQARYGQVRHRSRDLAIFASSGRQSSE